MNGQPENNEVSIDCNVFEHLWSRDANFNPDGHIAVLLAALILKQTKLCVDLGDVICGEYRERILPLFKKESQIGSEIEILRYWMEIDNHEEVDLTECKELMRLIRTIIIENERVDRTHVCVAFVHGHTLVTNDVMHIVVGPTKEAKLGERRVRLLRDTKKRRSKDADILRSSEAHLQMVPT